MGDLVGDPPFGGGAAKVRVSVRARPVVCGCTTQQGSWHAGDGWGPTVCGCDHEVGYFSQNLNRVGLFKHCVGFLALSCPKQKCESGGLVSRHPNTLQGTRIHSFTMLALLPSALSSRSVLLGIGECCESRWHGPLERTAWGVLVDPHHPVLVGECCWPATQTGLQFQDMRDPGPWSPNPALSHGHLKSCPCHCPSASHVYRFAPAFTPAC